ncbi:MAG: hypothetical protein PHU34_09395 [Candidatus Methanoperedens sp.]|nr:hypothetical protein [Candidatus Methanoperedens sp.]
MQKNNLIMVPTSVTIPDYYKEFLERHSSIFGDLNDLLSKLLIEEINRTYESLKSRAPITVDVDVLPDLRL